MRQPAVSSATVASGKGQASVTIHEQGGRSYAMPRCVLRRFACVLAAVVSLSGCAKVARLAAVQPAPMATPVRGEQTQPMPIRMGAAIDPKQALQRANVVHQVPATLGVPPNAASNGTAYYYDGTALTAFDLGRAAVQWRRAVQAQPDTIVATHYGVAFVQRYPQPLVYLSAQTGAQIFDAKDTSVSGALDGVLFAKNNDTFRLFRRRCENRRETLGHLRRRHADRRCAANPQRHAVPDFS